MFGLALLLGISPPGGLSPDGARSGAPAPHLAWRLDAQWRRAGNADWQAFRKAWGPRSTVRWDERTGTPRSVWLAGVPASDEARLVSDLALLADIDPSELVSGRVTKRGTRTLHHYTRRWKGAPVVGDQVLVVAESGRIGAVWLQLTPIAMAQTPRPGEVVFPVQRFAGADWATPAVSAQPTLATVSTRGPITTYTARDGAVLYRQDDRHFAQVDVTYLERTVGDTAVTAGAEGVTVTDAEGATDLTSATGAHSLTGDLTVTLDGPELTVSRRGSVVSATGTDDIELEGGGNLSQASASVLHHFHVVWDWLGARWPSHSWLSENVPADVDRTDGACNAYYTSGTVNFFQGSGSACHNFGQIADVIYHEVGHGIHHYILAGGGFAGDVSEGSADYVSATINDSYTLAPNATPSGGYIRELDTDRVYPDDAIGQVHNDGLIWGSFLWNLRTQWRADYGDTAGTEQTDLLFLGALEQGPSLTDLYEAVIVADDDDGDLTNGTPHGCDLKALLDQHGLGPGPIGVVQLNHTPLPDQQSDTAGYPVQFDVSAPLAACSDLDESSIQLWWTTDPARVPGVEEPWLDSGADSGGADSGGADSGDTGAPGVDDYDGWESLSLTRDGWTWTGELPRQPATTQVFYFIEAADTAGEQILRSHGSSRSQLYSFAVGDTEALWCEDFEGGATDWTHSADLPFPVRDPYWINDPYEPFADEWVVGPPVAGSYSADAAVSGANIAATAPGETYRNLNRQSLQSPEVTLDGPRPMLRLTFQRWLTVEDGVYDRALLWDASGDLVWENAPGGGGDHLLDQGWTQASFPITVPDEGGTVQYTWGLESDRGLEYGGWHLDDVCVTALADVEGHYRRASLQATDDAETVTISWEQPWIVPLTETVLLKRTDAWPEGPDDTVATELARYPEAVAGEALSVVDDTLAEGETAYYALFSFDGEVWYRDVIEGENADIGGVPAAPEPADTGDSATPEPEDSGEPDDTDEPVVESSPKNAAPEGCGCTATPTPGALAAALALLPLVARRRRG